MVIAWIVSFFYFFEVVLRDSGRLLIRKVLGEKWVKNLHELNNIWYVIVFNVETEIAFIFHDKIIEKSIIFLRNKALSRYHQCGNKGTQNLPNPVGGEGRGGRSLLQEKWISHMHLTRCGNVKYSMSRRGTIRSHSSENAKELSAL